MTLIKILRRYLIVLAVGLLSSSCLTGQSEASVSDVTYIEISESHYTYHEKLDPQPRQSSHFLWEGEIGGHSTPDSPYTDWIQEETAQAHDEPIEPTRLQLSAGLMNQIYLIWAYLFRYQ